MNPSIELPASALKTALAGLTKVINKSPALPVLSHILVTQRPHEIQLHGTNLDEFAQYRLETPATNPPLGCLVPYEPLNRILKHCTSAEVIRLTPQNEQEVTLAYPVGNNFVEQKLGTPPVKDWPPLPAVPQTGCYVDDKFKEALKTAFTCASGDASRYVLMGAFLDTTDRHNHYVVATDGRHLFANNSFAFDLPHPLLIPNRKFLNWPGFIEDSDWQILSTPPTAEVGWIKILSQHWTFITRKITGEYPNWRQVVPGKEHLSTTVYFPEEAARLVQEALPRLPGMQDPNQSVTLRVFAPQLSLHAQDHESPAGTDLVVPGAIVTGPPVTIAVNRGFLLKALKLGLVELALADATSPLLFSGPGKTLVAMPLRANGPAEPSATEASPETPANPVNSTNPTNPPSDPRVTIPAPPREAVAAPPPPGVPPSIITAVNPERNPMITHPTPPAPGERGALKPTPSEPSDPAPGVKTLAEQIDQIKTKLREVLVDLGGALDLVRLADKEKRQAQKEVDAIRATLRTLQRVQL